MRSEELDNQTTPSQTFSDQWSHKYNTVNELWPIFVEHVFIIEEKTNKNLLGNALLRYIKYL